jgi:hypothetical protein
MLPVWELIKKIQNKQPYEITNPLGYMGMCLIIEPDADKNKILDEAIKVSAVDPATPVIISKDHTDYVNALQDLVLAQSDKLQNAMVVLKERRALIEELYKRIDIQTAELKKYREE